MADLSDKTQNVSITSNDESKTVTVTTDGSKQRLDVDATVSGSTIVQDVRNLRQKATDGGQYFSVSSDTIGILGVGETNYLLVKNPSGSGVNFRWDKLFAWTFETSDLVAILRIYHNPTITSDGTALSEFDENSITNNTAKIEWFKTPTTSANGTLRTSFVFSSKQSLFHSFDLSHVMPPNSNMLITLQKETAGTQDVAFTTWWQEEPE